ncbi:Dual-specificity RNA pseudouridine synthase RluF OS=Castellaniella defragrans OX=75697 GN=HNR28_001687 PE=4 SV=1 [Castellaniella defragrans]
MAQRGLCSRREADAYIERGWVRVDGQIVHELGTKALPSARITLERQAARRQTDKVTLILNKPVGYASHQTDRGYRVAASLIRAQTQYHAQAGQRVFEPAHVRGLAPAGRLDIDSQGLLVLTQDGRIARQLIGEDSSLEKEYLVRVEGHMGPRGLVLLNHGLVLDGHALRPAQVQWQNDDQLHFVLREGRKRQIRRMCEQVGLKVVGLKRVRMGRVVLGDLPVGQWRYLREGERF